MAKTAFLSPKIQLFDDDAAPLAGGFLYFYAAGSSTPQNTWSSINPLTLNTNPVELDSAGRAVIYFGTAAYKIVVKNASLVTQYTIDDVSPAAVAS